MLDKLLRLDASRRVLAVVALAVVAVPMWLLVRWAASPTYVALYQELEWGQAGEVTSQLQSARIDYKLANGGTEVQVPAADLARARVLLASEGHSFVGRPGLELFDQPSWGMTDFTQRVTYRRALEGELARTIGRLHGIEGAQVHLALPESNPLRRMEQPAEAAVVLNARSGGPIAPDVVQGIAYLVSNAVEHLSSDNVAVLDASGRLLSAPNDPASSVGLSARQLEQQREVESYLASKAEAMITEWLGSGNARVQVAARLNFEQVDRTVEAFDPNGQVIAAEERSETAGPDGQTTAETIFKNTFENSRSVETVVGSVGNVERLTVAVLVNEDALLAEANGDASLAATQMQRLASLVRSAVGIDSTRGDQLSMVAIPFEKDETVDVATLGADSVSTGDPLQIVERFIRPVLGALGILLIFALGWRALRPTSSSRQLAASTQQPASVPSPEAAAAIAAAEANSLARVGGAQQLRQEILQGSAVPAENAAHVVRAWLSEGD